MRFAFSTNAFRRYSLLDSIRIVADAGYDGVEIMADVPHAYPLHLTPADVRQIRRTLDECRIEISNLNAFMHHADGDTYHPSWIERDSSLRAKRVDYTLRCIDLAAALGARHLSTEPGGPLQDMKREEGLRLFREGLRRVEDHAGRRRIKILIEPEPGLLIETPGEFLDLFRDLDPEVCGLNFDIGHFFCVGKDPAAWVEDLKAVTHHFHLEDIAASREHHHLMLGHGAVDIPQVLDKIHETGFDGFITVELYTYEDRPVEAVQESMKYLQFWRDLRRTAVP